jgi:hypothetical protein
MSATAQTPEMNVGNSLGTQFRPQRFAIEQWHIARLWDAPHIDNAFDTMSFQYGYELFERVRGVADRQYR